MEWSVVPVVSSVGVCPVLQQNRDHLGVPKGAGVVQGDQASVILHVHLGPVGQKEFNHILATKSYVRKESEK